MALLGETLSSGSVMAGGRSGMHSLVSEQSLMPAELAQG